MGLVCAAAEKATAARIVRRAERLSIMARTFQRSKLRCGREFVREITSLPCFEMQKEQTEYIKAVASGQCSAAQKDSKSEGYVLLRNATTPEFGNSVSMRKASSPPAAAPRTV